MRAFLPLASITLPLAALCENVGSIASLFNSLGLNPVNGLTHNDGEKDMKKQNQSALETGVTVKSSAKQIAGPPVQLFGHVTLVQGFALPNFLGCYALVLLRDTPGKIVAAMTTEPRLQTLLETALSTGKLMAFYGFKPTDPPTPRGGTWSVDVYLIDGVTLYNMP